MKQTEILTHATHVNGWFPAVYMSCMSQNFRLFHVSNLSVRNFRICLLMYTGSLSLRRLLSRCPLSRLGMYSLFGGLMQFEHLRALYRICSFQPQWLGSVVKKTVNSLQENVGGNGLSSTSQCLLFFRSQLCLYGELQKTSRYRFF